MYIKRLTAGIADADQALQKIAVQMITQGLATATPKEIEIWIADLLKKRALESGDTTTMERLSTILETPAEELVHPEEIDAPEPENKRLTDRLRTKKPPQALSGRLLPDLIGSGLLSAKKDGRLAFSHIVLSGYLAAEGLAEGKLTECLNDMPAWEGKYVTMRYLAAWDDLTPQVNPILENKRDPLQHGLFLVGGWLAESCKNNSWRGTALKRLATSLQNEVYPLSLRVRALCTLAATRDPGAGVLFRQLLTNRSDNVRLLAALGCGLVRDPKAVEELIQLLQDPCLEVGQAAILALASIHTQPALEAVAGTLLEGSEELRRTAAEALAYDPEDGHPVLSEGSQMEDLLVRRAVVYGLARVGQPWAEELLEKIQIEDGQWVVRSAATQALDEVRRLNPHAPRKLPAPTETPWILEVAGEMGMGVTPGKPVTDLVVQALKAGDPQHCRAALDYLVQHPEPATVPQIYQILFGPEGELREAAFNTLWHMYAAGMDLPSPKQFGLG
jgi:HEAT repeat protein